MVRFIIKKQAKIYRKWRIIYIPIWLDLLWEVDKLKTYTEPNLHSNMVRFIIRYAYNDKRVMRIFTFQYG